jgi:hypothetical protein
MSNSMDCFRTPLDDTVLSGECCQLEPASAFAMPNLSQALVEPLSKLLSRARLVDAKVDRVTQRASPCLDFRLKSRDCISESLVTRVAHLTPVEQFPLLSRPAEFPIPDAPKNAGLEEFLIRRVCEHSARSVFEVGIPFVGRADDRIQSLEPFEPHVGVVRGVSPRSPTFPLIRAHSLPRALSEVGFQSSQRDVGGGSRWRDKTGG